MTVSWLTRATLALTVALAATQCGWNEFSSDPNQSMTGDDDDDGPGAPDDDAQDDDSDDDSDDDGPVDSGKPGARIDGGANPRIDAGPGSRTDSSEPSKTDGGPPYTNSKFVNLAVPPGEPLDRAKGDTHPSSGFTPPTGWNWYNVAGAKCRDGSQNGMFVRFAEGSKKLMIYFEGGGACANPGFCTLNPVNVGTQFLTGGESAIASLVMLPIPQGPNGAGIFDLSNAENPFKDWNQVFIPYCTGDVHFGTIDEGKIEGVTGPLHFVGAKNTKLMIARLAATFKDVDRFVAGGSSAGAYGAGLNFGVIQDTFKNALGSALLDSGPPFTNDFMPACLQKRWREAWGLDGALPSDCGEECLAPDGSNLFQIVDYWRRKYPHARVGLVSGIHDEIIRLFFSLGNDDCKDYQADPPSLFIGSLAQTYPPDRFKMGLEQLRTKYAESGQLATYYMDGFPNATAHQCLFRPRFYEEAAGAGKPTIAAWLKEFVDGKMTHVGP